MGAILVFSLLITALGAYQAVVVPNTNEQVEFKHSNEVQQDLVELRNSIHRSSTDGGDTSVSVDLGVNYPVRSLTLNPPEKGGTIQVKSPGSSKLSIENAQALDGEVDDHWTTSGDEKEFSAGVLVYTPSYNIYREAPTTTIDNSVVFNRFPDDDESIALSGQRVVEGRKLSLVSLEGDLSTSQVETTPIDVRSVSTGKTQVSLTDTGSNIRVEIPTTLSQEVWVQQLLATEIDDPDGGPNGAGPETGDLCGDLNSGESDDDNDRYIVSCDYDSPPGDFNVLTLILEEDTTYTVDLAQVAIESKPPSPEAQYAVPVEGDDAAITSAQNQQLTVQVRDRFDNPVSGKTVTFEIQGSPPPGNLEAGTQVGSTVTVTTNENGVASVKYDPGGNDNINVDVEATTSVSGTPASTQADRETAEFTVSVGNPNPNNPGVGATVNPSGPLVLSDSTIFASTGGGSPNCSPSGSVSDCYVNVNITNNDGSNDLEIKEIRFNAYVGQSPGVSTTGSGLPDEMQICDSTNSDVFQRQSSYQSFFDSPIDDGDTKTYTVKFEANGADYSVLEGDYFVLSVTYGLDGGATTGTATYFVAPEASSSLTSGTNRCP